PITASTRSARLHFFQSATITHRHATLHGSARDCLPRSEGKSYDWQIHILAPSAKCDQHHTYKNILILLRGKFASVQAFGGILHSCMGVFVSSGRLVCCRFFVRSGKAVSRPVAGDEVRGARGRGKGTEMLA